MTATCVIKICMMCLLSTSDWTCLLMVSLRFAQVSSSTRLTHTQTHAHTNMRTPPPCTHHHHAYTTTTLGPGLLDAEKSIICLCRVQVSCLYEQPDWDFNGPSLFAVVSLHVLVFYAIQLVSEVASEYSCHPSVADVPAIELSFFVKHSDRLFIFAAFKLVSVLILCSIYA